MSFTMTRSVSESWTLTNAKYLASKVTTDMWRCRQNYGLPSETAINDYGTELALRLRDGFVSKYEFGFEIENERLLHLSAECTHCDRSRLPIPPSDDVLTGPQVAGVQELIASERQRMVGRRPQQVRGQL